MKCTQCGCKKFVKTDSPFGVQGDAWSTTRASLSIYACCECGHLEFFDPYHVGEYQGCVRDIKNIPLEIEELKKQLSELQEPTVLLSVKEEMKQIEQKLTSIDITIRQQQELKEKLKKLRITASDIPQKINQIESKIWKLEKELSEAEKKLKKVEVIEG